MATPRSAPHGDRADAPLLQQRLSRPAPTFHGHSAAARRVQALIHRAVRTPAPVLIVGATGTGRLSIARVIHHFGAGEVPNLDVVRPAPGDELVGLGGFTYLADLENLGREQQVRLPALVGGGRIVLATQVDPSSPDGRRRLDARLIKWAAGGVRIDVPTLTERSEDLELIAMQILARVPSRVPLGGIGDDALDVLRGYHWPGQIDELELVLREAAARASGSQIDLRDLPVRLRVRDAEVPSFTLEAEGELELGRAERRAIRRALAYSRGNRRKAARVLGIGKTTLYRKLREYGLE